MPRGEEADRKKRGENGKKPDGEGRGGPQKAAQLPLSMKMKWGRKTRESTRIKQERRAQRAEERAKSEIKDEHG